MFFLSNTFEMFQFFEIIPVSDFVLHGFTGFLLKVERTRVDDIAVEQD
jgi:hypothetical protein